MELRCHKCNEVLKFVANGFHIGYNVEACKVCNPELSSHVLRFAAAMQAKLDANDGDKCGWGDLTNQECFESILEELKELQDAVVNNWSPDIVDGEAADAANFLCFLVTNYRRRFGKG